MNGSIENVDAAVSAGPAERVEEPTPGSRTAPPARQAYPPAAAASDSRRKSVPLACVLSLMPGLGQVYVGYYRHGFVHALTVAGLIAILNLNIPEFLYPLLGLFLGFFWLYNIVDAGRRAAFWNQALAGTAGVDLPQDLSLPGPGGSLAGGVALILVGAVFLPHTLLDIPLDWLEEWWPVAPLLVGVYLVVRGLRDRRENEV